MEICMKQFAKKETNDELHKTEMLEVIFVGWCSCLSLPYTLEVSFSEKISEKSKKNIERQEKGGSESLKMLAPGSLFWCENKRVTEENK